MTATLEQIADNKVKLSIEVDAETFEKGIQTAYRKTAGKYKVPGFRQGKAPRKVIENMMGEGVFFEDAVDEVMPPAYMQAVEEHELQPVGRPEIELVKLGTGEQLVFTAEVFVKPPVQLGEYKGIEVERVEYNVSDDQVKAEVDKAIEGAARYVESDQPIENGDRVVFDYLGTESGVPFEGGSQENASLDIGSGRFIPGFEEQMVGLKAGDEKDLNVTFPEEYPHAELAGKEAVFHVLVHEVKKKELPPLDDETIKDISDEFDTVEEFTADCRKKLEEAARKEAEGKQEDAAIKVIVENASVNIPDCMVDEQIDQMIQDMQYQFRMNGMSFDDFLSYTNSSIEEYRGNAREGALQRVKTGLVMEEIQKAENVEATDEDMDAELAKLAEAREKDLDFIKANVSDAERDYIKQNVIINKTVDMLMAQVKLIEPKPKAEAEEKTEE